MTEKLLKVTLSQNTHMKKSKFLNQKLQIVTKFTESVKKEKKYIL